MKQPLNRVRQQLIRRLGRRDRLFPEPTKKPKSCYAAEREGSVTHLRKLFEFPMNKLTCAEECERHDSKNLLPMAPADNVEKSLKPCN
jgi:hypothetical protein